MHQDGKLTQENASGPRAETNAAPTEDVGPRFLCPACHTARLVAVLEDDTSLARCRNCHHEVRDLLSLVPVEPVGLLEITLGRGISAYVRGCLFAVMVLLLLATAILWR